VRTISSASSSSISTRRRTAFFCSGREVRKRNRWVVAAYRHADRSHLPLAFVECSEGFVESLVHTNRRGKWGMSPSCVVVLGNERCGDKSGARGNLIPVRAITCGRASYARFTMSLPARLQAASTEYQKLQVDLSNAVDARQRLDAQLSENELVKKVRERCTLFSRIPESSSLPHDHGHCRSSPH